MTEVFYKKRFTILCLFAFIISLVITPKSFAISPIFDHSEITISREIIDVSEPVSNTFTYTITPDDDNPGTVTNAPSSASIEFDNVEPSADGRALASSTLDFSEMTFSDMGSYIFLIEETESTNPDDYPIIDNIKFKIIINVGYPTDANGVPDNSRIVANVLETAKKIVDGVEQGNKQEVLWTLFEEVEPSIETTMIAVQTETIGAIAGLQPQCFAYSINISSPDFAEGETPILMTRKTVDGEPSACAPDGSDGNYEITPGERVVFLLAHGEVAYVTVPVGTEYTIARVENTGIEYDGKYTTKIDNRLVNSITKVAAALSVDDVIQLLLNGTPSSNSTFIQLTNRDNPRTNIIVNAWPFLILVVFVVVGVAIIAFSSRHSKKKDEKLDASQQ